MKTLRKGNRGPEVRTLQEKLTAVKHPLNPIDDIFGTNTDTAVRNFQRQNKLKVDGVAGTNTWDALVAAITAIKNTMIIKTVRNGNRGPLIRSLQEQLTAAGFPIQPTTEYFGPITDSAVRHFQRKNKLLADGIVGPNTWHALGLTDNNKPNVKPINSLDSLIASLGFLGTSSAVNACFAPKTIDVAKPVSQLKTSLKGLQFLYTREAWKDKSNRLHWPKGGSGVTLGPGYDMKERNETEIIHDMLSIKLDAATAKSIAKGAGLRGAEAETFCKTNNNLVILKDKTEFELMKLVVPHYELLVRRKIKIELMPYEFDALVSFAYNYGELWWSLATPINDGKIETAMTVMKNYNKSDGKINDGLINRRAFEIALYTFGNYGKLRVV